MNIFSRVMDIVNANVTALLEKAEDPEKMIRLMIKEMEDTIVELKTSCASTMAHKKRLERNSNELKASIKRWESRAVLALEHKRDDLAKEALIEKKKVQDELDKTQRELDNDQEYINLKKSDISKIETKLNKARNKYKSIKEEKEKQANDLKYAYDNEPKYDWSENYDKMNNNEYESIDKKFENLENMSEIEKELEALKNKLRK